MKLKSVLALTFFLSFVFACSKKQSLSTDDDLEGMRGVEYKSTNRSSIKAEYDSSVMVTTYAGSYYRREHIDGDIKNASFSSLYDIKMDSDGSLYVSDDTKFRHISATGWVSSLRVISADPNMPSYITPSGFCLDASGNILFTQTWRHSISSLNMTNAVYSTIAGNFAGYQDGPRLQARFFYPQRMAFDASGNLFVTDQYNHRIRKITPQQMVSTIAGNGIAGSIDGQGLNASFRDPNGITIDPKGNLFVTDQSAIRKIAPDGTVTTLAGSDSEGDSDGQGQQARFSFLQGITIDALGNLFVVDRGNGKIKKITPDGIVTTLAGDGTLYETPVDGPGRTARFYSPWSIAIDASGHTLYVTDANTVRKITF